MTDQEIINQNIQRQIDAQNARIDNVLNKVDMLLTESQQQREDMRRLQDRQDAMQAKHETEIHEMNQRFYQKFDDLTKQINDTWRQTMIGVGGMIIALGALILTALK